MLNGLLSLSDFGCSERMDSDDLKQLHDAAGTASWMAPELVNRKAHFNTDVFSFGLLLYRLAGMTDGSPREDDPDNRFPIDDDILQLAMECTHPVWHQRPTAEQLVSHPVFNGVNVVDTCAMLGAQPLEFAESFVGEGDRWLDWEEFRNHIRPHVPLRLVPNIKLEQGQTPPVNQSAESGFDTMDVDPHPAPTHPSHAYGSDVGYDLLSSSSSSSSSDAEQAPPVVDPIHEAQLALVKRHPWLLSVDKMVELIILAKASQWEHMAAITGVPAQFFETKGASDKVDVAESSKSFQFDATNGALVEIAAAVVEIQRDVLSGGGHVTHIPRAGIESRAKVPQARNSRNIAAVMQILRKFDLVLETAHDVFVDL
eukprot:TRINITY_DN2549_c0_g1_i1.p1 TRINITY_DN2549_c0_g1~~TRINITY_DN2549_c0_g1_i1.p1  ORF type:complete len:370 (-),score=83.27 TRINITY_DN2549_c0_g1_i1:610-1719(-)